MTKKIIGLLLMTPLVAICGWVFWVFWFQGKDYGGRELFMFLVGIAALGTAFSGSVWLFGEGWRILFERKSK